MSNHPQTATWTNDRKQIVANLLREGYSAGKISTDLGVSRSAVISVVHRDPALREIGFARSAARAKKLAIEPSARKSALIPASRAKPSRNVATPAPAIVKPAELSVVEIVYEEIAPDPAVVHGFAAPDPLALPLADLNRNQCRFVVNNAAKGEQHLFCGHEVRPGKYYCPDHYRRMYQPRQNAGA